METVLGTRMHAAGIVLHGHLDQVQWMHLLRKITFAIGMEPVGEPAIWVYPVDGKGGSGVTMVLPITESFLALDTWSDHDGAYLFICSCRMYDVNAVNAVVVASGLAMEWSPDKVFSRSLRLK